MTKIAVNSKPKSFKGSNGNKLIVDPEDLQQSEVHLNSIDNNGVDEIEEEKKNNGVDAIENTSTDSKC
jgi:hypothetical protein